MFSLRISKFTIPDLPSATLTATSPSFTSIAAYRGPVADGTSITGCSPTTVKGGSNTSSPLLVVDLYRTRGLLKPFSRAENEKKPNSSNMGKSSDKAASSPSRQLANTADANKKSAALLSATVDDWTRYEHIRIDLGLTIDQCKGIDAIEGVPGSMLTMEAEKQLAVVCLLWLTDTLLVATCRNRTGTHTSVKLVSISPLPPTSTHSSGSAAKRSSSSYSVDPLLSTVFTGHSADEALLAASVATSSSSSVGIVVDRLAESAVTHLEDINRRKWSAHERVVVTSIPAPLMEHLLNRTATHLQTPCTYNKAIYQQSTLFRARMEGRSLAEDLLSDTDGGDAAAADPRVIDTLIVGQRIQCSIWGVVLDTSARGAIWVQMDNMVGCIAVSDLLAARALEEESLLAAGSSSASSPSRRQREAGAAGGSGEGNEGGASNATIAEAPISLQVLYRVPINTNMVVHYFLEWDTKCQDTVRSLMATAPSLRHSPVELIFSFRKRLEDDLLISFQHLPIPLWAAASRYVCVFDDEYSELKIWALQASNAVICVANLPMRLPLGNTTTGGGANASASSSAIGPVNPLMSTYTQALSTSSSADHEGSFNEHPANASSSSSPATVSIPAGKLDAIRQLRLSCPLPPMHSLRLSEDASTVFIMYYRESTDHVVTNANRFLAAVANTSIALQNDSTLAEKAAVLRRRAASLMNNDEANRLELLLRLEGSKRLDVYLQLLDLERILRSQSAAAIAERGATARPGAVSAGGAPVVSMAAAGGNSISSAAMAVTNVDFTRVFCGDELRIESSISLPWGAIERASQEKVDLYSRKFLIPIDDVPTPTDLLVSRASYDHGNQGPQSLTEGDNGEASIKDLPPNSACNTPVNFNAGAWGGFLSAPDSPLHVQLQHIAIVDNTVVLFLSTGVVFSVKHTGETSMHDVSHWRPETMPDDDVAGKQNSGDNQLQSVADDANEAALSAMTGPCAWLRCPRPPLPPFVTSLLLREEGCYAYFAASKGEINKDALLRNEINHGGATTAVTLCQLNGWSAAEIQETTLQLAVSESAEAAYHVVSMAFKDDCRKRRSNPAASSSATAAAAGLFQGQKRSNAAITSIAGVEGSNVGVEGPSPIRPFSVSHPLLASPSSPTMARPPAALPSSSSSPLALPAAAAASTNSFSNVNDSICSTSAAVASPTTRNPAVATAADETAAAFGNLVHVEELLTNLVYTPDTERPTDTLHLLTRLCNMVCVRFDNCPDEPSARRTLKNLIATCISMLSVVGRYCAEFSDDTIVAYRTYPSEAHRIADANEDSYLSKLIREAAPLHPPFAPADEAQRRRVFNSNDESLMGGACVSADRRRLFDQLAYCPLLASEDTYLLLALRQGMLEMRAAVKEQSQIYGITSDTVNWSSRPKGMIALSDGVVVATGGDTNSNLVNAGASSYAPPTIAYSTTSPQQGGVGGVRTLLEHVDQQRALCAAMDANETMPASLVGKLWPNEYPSSESPLLSLNQIGGASNNTHALPTGTRLEVPEVLRVDWLRLTETVMDILTAVPSSSLVSAALNSSAMTAPVTNALFFMNMILPSLSHTLLTVLDFCCFPATSSGEHLITAFSGSSADLASLGGGGGGSNYQYGNAYGNHLNSDGQPFEYFRRCAGLAVAGESQESAALRNDKKSPFLLRHLQFMVSYIVYERLLRIAFADPRVGSTEEEDGRGDELTGDAHHISSSCSSFSPAAIEIAAQSRAVLATVFGKRLASLWWALLERKTVVPALSELMTAARVRMSNQSKKSKESEKSAEKQPNPADAALSEASALMANFEAIARDLEKVYTSQAIGLDDDVTTASPSKIAQQTECANDASSNNLDDSTVLATAPSAPAAQQSAPLRASSMSYLDHSSYASAFFKSTVWMSNYEQKSQEAVKVLMAKGSCNVTSTTVATDNDNAVKGTEKDLLSHLDASKLLLGKALEAPDVQRSILAWVMSVQHKQPFLGTQPQYNEGLYTNVLLRMSNATVVDSLQQEQQQRKNPEGLNDDNANADDSSDTRGMDSTVGAGGAAILASVQMIKGVAMLDGSSLDMIFNVLLGGLASPFTDFTETPPNESEDGDGADGHMNAAHSNALASGVSGGAGMVSSSNIAPLPLGHSGRKLLMPVCPRNLPFHATYRPRHSSPTLVNNSGGANANNKRDSVHNHQTSSASPASSSGSGIVVEHWKSLQHSLLFAADDATTTVQRLAWMETQIDRQRRAKALNLTLDGNTTNANSTSNKPPATASVIAGGNRSTLLTVKGSGANFAAANSKESEVNSATLTATSQLVSAAIAHSATPHHNARNSYNSTNNHSSSSSGGGGGGGEWLQGAFVPAYVAPPLMATSTTQLTSCAPFAMSHAVDDLSQGLLDVIEVAEDEAEEQSEGDEKPASSSTPPPPPPASPLARKPLFSWYVALVERLFMLYAVETTGPFVATANCTVLSEEKCGDASALISSLNNNKTLTPHATTAFARLLGVADLRSLVATSPSGPNAASLYSAVRDPDLLLTALVEFVLRRADTRGFFSWATHIVLESAAEKGSGKQLGFAKHMLSVLLAFANAGNVIIGDADASVIRRRMALLHLGHLVEKAVEADVMLTDEWEALVMPSSSSSSSKNVLSAAAFVWEALTSGPRSVKVERLTTSILAKALTTIASPATDRDASVVLAGLSPLQLVQLIRKNGTADTTDNLIAAAMTLVAKQQQQQNATALIAAPPCAAVANNNNNYAFHNASLFSRYSLYLAAVGAALRVLSPSKHKKAPSFVEEATFTLLTMLHQEHLFSADVSCTLKTANASSLSVAAMAAAAGSALLRTTLASVPRNLTPLVASCLCDADAAVLMRAVVGTILRTGYVLRLADDASTTPFLLLRVGNSSVALAKALTPLVGSRRVSAAFTPFVSALRNRVILTLKAMPHHTSKASVTALKTLAAQLSSIVLSQGEEARAQSGEKNTTADGVSDVIHNCFNALFPSNVSAAIANNGKKSTEGPSYSFALRPASSGDDGEKSGTGDAVGLALSPAVAGWFLGLSGQKLEDEQSRLLSRRGKQQAAQQHGGGISSYTYDPEADVTQGNGNAAMLVESLSHWRATGRVVSVRGDAEPTAASPSTSIDAVTVANLLDDLRPFSAYYYTKARVEASVEREGATVVQKFIMTERLITAARGYALSRAHRPSALAVSSMYLQLLQGMVGVAEEATSRVAESDRLLVDAAVVRIVCGALSHCPSVFGDSADSIVEALAFLPTASPHELAPTLQRGTSNVESASAKHLSTLMKALHAIHSAAVKKASAASSLGDDVTDLIAEQHTMLRTFTADGALSMNGVCSRAASTPKFIADGDEAWDVAPWLALGANGCSKENIGTAVSDITVRFAGCYSDQLLSEAWCARVVQDYFASRWMGGEVNASSSAVPTAAWMTTLFQAFTLNVPPTMLLVPESSSSSSSSDADATKVPSDATQEHQQQQQQTVSRWHLPILHALRKLCSKSNPATMTSSPQVTLLVASSPSDASSSASATELSRRVRSIIDDAVTNTLSTMHHPTVESLLIFKGIPLLRRMCGANFAADLSKWIVTQRGDDWDADAKTGYLSSVIAIISLGAAKGLRARDVRALLLRLEPAVRDFALEEDAADEDQTEALTVAVDGASLLDALSSILKMMVRSHCSSALVETNDFAPMNAATVTPPPSVIALEFVLHTLRIVKAVDETNTEYAMTESARLGGETLFNTPLLQLYNASSSGMAMEKTAFVACAAMFLALMEGLARGCWQAIQRGPTDADDDFGESHEKTISAVAATSTLLCQVLFTVLGDAATNVSAILSLPLAWQLVARCASLLVVGDAACDKGCDQKTLSLQSSLSSRESVTLAASILSLPQCAIVAFSAPFVGENATTAESAAHKVSVAEVFVGSDDRSVQIRLIRFAAECMGQPFVELSMAVLPSHSTLKRTIALLEANGALNTNRAHLNSGANDMSERGSSQGSGEPSSVPSSFSLRRREASPGFASRDNRDNNSAPAGLKPLSETEKRQRRHMWSLVGQRALHRQLGRSEGSTSSISPLDAAPNAANEHTDGEFSLAGRLGGHYLLLPRALQAATALVQALLSPSAPIVNNVTAGSFLDDSARAARARGGAVGGGNNSHPAFSIPDYGPWRTIAEAFAPYIAESGAIQKCILERAAGGGSHDPSHDTTDSASPPKNSAFAAAIADSILVLSEARHVPDSGLELCGMFHCDAERVAVLEDLVEEVMEEVGKFEDEAQMEIVRLLSHEAFAREVLAMTISVEADTTNPGTSPNSDFGGSPSSFRDSHDLGSFSTNAGQQSTHQQKRAETERFWWLSPSVVRWCLAKIVAHSDTIAKQEGDAIKAFASFADALVTAVEGAKKEKLEEIEAAAASATDEASATLAAESAKALERHVGSLLARVLSTVYLTLYSNDCAREVHDLSNMAKASLAITTSSSPVLPSPRGSSSSATSRFTRGVSFRSKASSASAASKATTIAHSTVADAVPPPPSPPAPYDPIGEALAAAAKAKEAQRIEEQRAFQESLLQQQQQMAVASSAGAEGEGGEDDVAIAGSVPVAVKKRVVVVKKKKAAANAANAEESNTAAATVTDAPADDGAATATSALIPLTSPNAEEEPLAQTQNTMVEEPGSMRKKVVIKKVVKKVKKSAAGATEDAAGAGETAAAPAEDVREVTVTSVPTAPAVVPIWQQTASAATAKKSSLLSPATQATEASSTPSPKRAVPAIPASAANDLLEATGASRFVSSMAAASVTVSPIAVQPLQEDAFLSSVLGKHLSIPSPQATQSSAALAEELAPWQWARQLMGADRQWMRSVWDEKIATAISSSSAKAGDGATTDATLDRKRAVREKRTARRQALAILRQQAIQLQQQQATALAQLASTTQMSEEMVGQFMTMMQANNSSNGYMGDFAPASAQVSSSATAPSANATQQGATAEDEADPMASLLANDPDYDDWVSDDCSSDEDAELDENGTMVTVKEAEEANLAAALKAPRRRKVATHVAKDPFAEAPMAPYRCMSARAYYRDIKLPRFFAAADATQVWETTVRMLLEMTKKMRKRQRAEREEAAKNAALSSGFNATKAAAEPTVAQLQQKKKKEQEAREEMAMVQQLMRSTIATILTFPNHNLVDVLPEVTRLLDVGTNNMLRRCRVKVPNPNRVLDFATAHAHPLGDKHRPLSVEMRETMLAEAEAKIVSQVPLLKATMMLSADPEEILGPCTSPSAQLACEVGTSVATITSPSATVLRQYYFNLCRDALLHSHFVPLLIDCGRNALAREHKRYPNAERNFEGDVEAFFFDDSSLFMATGGAPNLTGLGEASGWTSVRRIDALCSFLRQLWHTEDGSSSVQKQQQQQNADNITRKRFTSFAALADTDGAIDDPPSTTRLGLAIFAKIKCFQRSVQLPERRFYSRIFLEPLAFCVTACTWMLQHTHDTLLASLVASEFKAVVTYSMLDGDYELLRKMMFSMGDISVLKFVCDTVPPSQFAALLNSSPEFQRTPLHSSSMRLSIMAYFERMTSPHIIHGPNDGSAEAAAQMEITTLYANFYHFTALGETLHMEADDLLSNFVETAGGLLGAGGVAVPQLTKKTSWLGNLTGSNDKNKDGTGAVGNEAQQLELLRKQNRLLDEMEGQLSAAANFFVQDSMYQQCLACVRRLQLIGVQRRYLYIKVPILGRDLRNFKLAAVLANGSKGPSFIAEAKASVLAGVTRGGTHRDSVMGFQQDPNDDNAQTNFLKGAAASTSAFEPSETTAKINATFELIRQLLMSGASSNYQFNPMAEHHPALVDPADVFRCAAGYDVANSLVDLAILFNNHVVANGKRNLFAYYVEHTLHCSKALIDSVENMMTEDINEQTTGAGKGGMDAKLTNAIASRRANFKWMQDVVSADANSSSAQ